MIHNLIDFQVEDFQTLIEQSPTSIILMDINWNIIYVNPRFIQLTGYTEEEAIGKNPRFQNSGDIGPEEYNEITDTVLSGKVWKGEFLNRKKNGELYNEFAVISPIKNNEGKITRIISLKEDITELRKTEKAYHDSEKFAALGKMASYITHEIKTPLTSIKTNIDMLLRKSDLPGYVNKSLGIVHSEITRLSSLLSNIRESTRQEEFEFSEIYLPDLFNSIHEIISPQLDLKGIKFINNVSGCKIFGDINKLKSLFMLLIENSISAVCQEGQIEIY
ncbi:MAG: PAS domain S-box protein, partial [Ignavibacteriaceae bacterium]